MKGSYNLLRYYTNNDSSNLDGIQHKTPTQASVNCNLRTSLRAKKKRFHTSEAPNIQGYKRGEEDG